MTPEIKPTAKLFFIFTREAPIRVLGQNNLDSVLSVFQIFADEIQNQLNVFQESFPNLLLYAVADFIKEGHFVQQLLELWLDYSQNQLEQVDELVASLQALALLADIKVGVAFNTKVAQNATSSQYSLHYPIVGETTT